MEQNDIQKETVDEMIQIVHKTIGMNRKVIDILLSGMNYMSQLNEHKLNDTEKVSELKESNLTFIHDCLTEVDKILELK